MSWGKEEKKCFSLVEQVIGEEKYECIILKFMISVSSNKSGNVNKVCFRGLFWIIYIYIFGIAKLFPFQNFLLVGHYGGIGSITIVVGLVVC